MCYPRVWRIELTTFEAMFALPGYTFKGIYEELRKFHGSSVQNYIIAARTAQGYSEWRASTEPQRTEILKQWHTTQIELAKQKKSKSSRSYSPSGFMKTRHMSFDERKNLAREKVTQKARKKDVEQAGSENDRSRSPAAITCHGSVRSVNRSIHELATATNDIDFENAIRDSVAATSTGDTVQDKMIERAIRASVAELRLASSEGANDDAIRRAIQASLAVAGRGQGDLVQNGVDRIDGEEQHKHMESVLVSSLQEPESDNSGIDTDDDINIKRAIEESKNSAIAPPGYDDDVDVREAIRLSQEHEQNRREATAMAVQEEDIVVEYIKKQSLLEEEYRQIKEAKAFQERKNASNVNEFSKLS